MLADPGDEELYRAMRAFLVKEMRPLDGLDVVQVLEALKRPRLPWASNSRRDHKIGEFVKIACGKVKSTSLSQFLLARRKNAAGKILLDLKPGTAV